jgi:hypothetical protein
MPHIYAMSLASISQGRTANARARVNSIIALAAIYILGDVGILIINIWMFCPFFRLWILFTRIAPYFIRIF